MKCVYGKINLLESDNALWYSDSYSRFCCLFLTILFGLIDRRELRSMTYVAQFSWSLVTSVALMGPSKGE